MPEAEFNGKKKRFRTHSQAEHYRRTGKDPSPLQTAANEIVGETRPENVLNESPLLGRMKVVKPESDRVVGVIRACSSVG